ncbi:MAG: radical SAM protein [Firmicutes bacterium]|nr:radical SAM protein [Bacillota bacterium]
MRFKKIYIEITNKCNLNCSFCSIDNNTKKEMSLEDFEIVLNKINDYTDYIYLHVKGEPLIHSKFSEILKLCKKYNKQVNITTNGTLLINKLTDIVESNIVRQINISMQSLTDEKYLIDILDSVKYLLNNSQIQLVFRFWALKRNEFTSLENKIIKEIINYFNLSEETIKQIYTLKNIKLLNNLYLNKDDVFEWPNLESKYYNELGHCYGLKKHIGILVDGTVVPCCLDSKGIINLGNIFKTDLNDILDSQRVKNIIKGFNENKPCENLCKRCSFKDKFKKSNV